MILLRKPKDKDKLRWWRLSSKHRRPIKRVAQTIECDSRQRGASNWYLSRTFKRHTENDFSYFLIRTKVSQDFENVRKNKQPVNSKKDLSKEGMEKPQFHRLYLIPHLVPQSVLPRSREDDGVWENDNVRVTWLCALVLAVSQHLYGFIYSTLILSQTKTRVYESLKQNDLSLLFPNHV